MYKGLIKFSATEDWNWDTEPVQLLHNSNTLTKAGAANDELRAEKTAGQTDALVIALGAYEGTGANRNGDIFKEAECLKHYKTFVKSGSRGKDGKHDGRALNRHHKNKPEDPKYGNIKAAAYNQKMKRIELVIGMDNDKCAEEIQKLAEGKQINVSMAAKVAYDKCFVAGTLVETTDGLIPIEKLCVGDLVKTHTGGWKPVVRLFEREYIGDVYTLEARGVAFDTDMTEGHPVYVLREEKVRNGTLNGRGTARRIDREKIQFTPDWINIEDVNDGDFLLYPIPSSDNSLDLSRHAYALGLYLGDGAIIWSRGKDNTKPLGLSWTFDDKDVEIVDRLVALYPAAKKYHYSDKHCYSVCLRDKELAQLAYSYCGVYSSEKFIHVSLIANATVETRQLFVAGYLDSDGSIDGVKLSGRISSINVDVIYSLRQLLLSLEIPCGWQKSPTFEYNSDKPTGEYIHSIHIGAFYCDKYFSSSVKVQKYGGFKPKQDKAFIHSGYLITPVREITSTTSTQTKVFNVQVEDDESYVVHGFIVHNCTWCGYEAKDDRHRCKHVPKELGEINKRGEMCSMDNIDPKWFELSIVGRPADRIGMSLKLASDNNYIKTANDYRELYPGFVAPDDEDNYLRISKYASEKRSLVRKLAAIEKHIDGVIEGGPKNSKDKYLAEQKGKINHADGISESAMDELRKYEPSKLLKALADHGIVFSPEDFVKYTFGAESLKNTGGMVGKMKKHLPSMFSDIEEDGDDVINDEKYEPSHSDIMPKGIMNIVRGLMDDHSLFDKPSHGRIMRITIVKKMPHAKLSGRSHEKEMPKEAAIKEIAKQYAAYKLAALRYLDSQDKLDEELVFNTLVQNR